MFALALTLLILLNQYCHAEDFNWQMNIGNQSTSFSVGGSDEKNRGRVDVDASGPVTVASYRAQSFEGGEDIFVFSFMKQQDVLRNSQTLKGKIPFRFDMVKRENFEIRNEGSLVFARLDGLPRNKQTGYQFVQNLYGFRDGFVSSFSTDRSQFGIRAGGEVVTADLSDTFGYKKPKWDNYGLRYGAFIKSRFSDNILFQINADGWRTKYNLDKYFFTEKWGSETKILSETTFLVNKNVELIPLLGYRHFDVERDGQVDLEELQYGGQLVYITHSHPDTKLFLNTILALKFRGKGSENLISAGVESKILSAEVYEHQTIDSYSDFEIKDRLAGIKLSWKFGSKPRNLESYQSVKDRNSFYLDNGNEDIKGLTLKQQAERLGTIRKETEWSNNLKYADELLTVNQVYQSRDGNCEGQSCTNVTMNGLNGYKGYDVGWWDLGKSNIGHGAEIVQDPRNKQWFFIEYGTTYKLIGLSPNAGIATVAGAAVKQNNLYSVLPLSNPINPVFAVFDCNDGQKYTQVTDYISLTNLSSGIRRPNIENGAELFIGRDFLFQ